MVHENCSRKSEGKRLFFAILSWVLQWLQPVLKMLHETIKKKYN